MASTRSTSPTAAPPRRSRTGSERTSWAANVFTRVVYGARVLLAIGIMSAAVSVAIGIAVGGTAGYVGRWVEDALMRFTDAMLSIPRLPLLMIAAAVLQPGVPTLILLVGVAGWMETARVVRADVQSIKTRDFVSAARALGAAPRRIVLRHVLPSAFRRRPSQRQSRSAAEFCSRAR